MKNNAYMEIHGKHTNAGEATGKINFSLKLFTKKIKKTTRDEILVLHRMSF